MGAEAEDRLTSPAPPGLEAPAERAAASCVLFGEIENGGTFYGVLAFLGRARWRGELVVQIDDVRRSLFLDEGCVVAAQSSAPVERIGEILVRTGLITDEDRERCIAKQGDGSLRFGEAAVELGLITTQQIFRAMDDQLAAVFSAVVEARRGSFYFLLGFDEGRLSFRQRHAVDSLLVKAIDRIDEIDYFRSRVPSDEHVPTRTPDREPPGHDVLGVYAAIDGERSVAAIREHCAGAKDIDVLRSLFELAESGCVTIEPPRIGAAKVVEIYNRAIALLLRELDAMDEADEVRAKLATFAEDASIDAFAGAGPAEDGTFDAAIVEANVDGTVRGEERVTKWLYDYASYGLFLARPHLSRRDGAYPPRDDARISMRVAALLAPIAPREHALTTYPEEVVILNAPPRTTVPVLASPPAASIKNARELQKTAKLDAAKIPALPGIDPTRTVRMPPISDRFVAAKSPSAPRPGGHLHRPARVPVVPAPAAPARVAPPRPVVPKGARVPSAVVLAVVVGASALAAIVMALYVRLPEPAAPVGREAHTRAELVVACEPECDAVHVDGTRMDARHGAFAVAPGEHEIIGSKPGYRTALKRVSIADGESRAVALLLRRD